MVGDVRGKSPIIAAVLEQVSQGHGGVGEPVNEDCLQESLDVVEAPGGGSNVGCETNTRVAGVSVDDPGSNIEEQVDKERSSILTEEHRGPAYQPIRC